jgi:hypothetical protein
MVSASPSSADSAEGYRQRLFAQFDAVNALLLP